MPLYDNTTRAQALTLKLAGVSNAKITSITGIKTQNLNLLYQKAISRGLNPSEDAKLLDIHVQDAACSGWLKKQTDTIKEEVLSKVRTDCYGRKKTCTQIAAEVGGVCDITVWRILRASGLKKTKPTHKSGLTKAMKKARLQFALGHQSWTLDNWKRIIWSDKTSVVIGFQRGGYNRAHSASPSATHCNKNFSATINFYLNKSN
jgi:transposase